ncbi:MAG TPA: T9SS type A sorting domain-containing protein, partial [Bacteroidales bacterium]|nr:T9SS type A sorting domain-containing protein [Bacteroidales bacterium]
TAVIPGQAAGTTVSYYVFSSTLTGITADYDLVTINFNNNSGANYSYTVETPPPSITFANLQWPGQGQIIPRQDFDVFGQAYIPGVTGQAVPAAGLQAWVGWNSANTDPSTWTDWIIASYNAPAGNNDEFKANLGNAVEWPGTYYYATRFKLNTDPFVYGGFSGTGGGFWDGITNISGVLDVLVGMPETGKEHLAVYPNPVTDRFSLELPDRTWVQITNTLGAIVVNQSLASGKQEINLAGWPAGVYHLQVNLPGRIVHQSILKR